MGAQEPQPRGPSEFIPTVYTDGSYAEEAPGVGYTGYGVWFGDMDPQNISCPLAGDALAGDAQTNNRAE